MATAREVVARLLVDASQTKGELDSMAANADASAEDLRAAMERAQGGVDKVTDALRELGATNAHPTIDLNSDPAQRKIDTILARLNQLRDGDYRARVGLEDAVANAEIDRLQARLDRMRGEDVHPKVNVDTGESNAKLDLLKAKMDAAKEGTNNLVLAAGLLGPALVPAAAAATAGVGALLPVVAAAGVGFGALGILALPVLSDVTKGAQNVQTAQDALNKAVKDYGPLSTQAKTATQNLNAAWAQMTPLEQQVTHGLLDLKKEVKDLGSQIAPQVLGALTTFLNDAKTLLPQLLPPAREAALALNDLGGSLGRSLGSPAWQHFLAVIVPEVRPAIDAIGRSFGELVKGIGGVIEAFVPFTGTVENGMLRVTTAFANWGQQLGSSQGFYHFMDFVRANTPELKRLLTDVANAAENLVKAAGQFGGMDLKALDFLAQALSTLTKLPLGPQVVEIGLLALALNKFGILPFVVSGLGNLAGAIKVLAGAGIAEDATMLERLGASLKTLATGSAGGGVLSKLGSDAKTAAPALAGVGTGGEAAAGGLGSVGAAAGAMAIPLGIAVAVVGGILLGVNATSKASDNLKLSVQDQKNKWGDLNTQLLTTVPAMDKNTQAMQRASQAHQDYANTAQTAIQATKQQQDAFHQNALSMAQMNVDESNAWKISAIEARDGGKATKEGLVAELGIGRADVDRILGEYNITAVSRFGEQKIIAASGGAQTVQELAKALNVGVPQVEAIAGQYGVKLATQEQVMAIQAASGGKTTVDQLTQQLGLGRDQIETIGRQYNLKLAGTTAEMVLTANAGGMQTVLSLSDQLHLGIADVENIGHQYGLKWQDQQATDAVISSVGGADTVKALADKLGVGTDQIGQIVATYGKLLQAGINPVLEGIGAKDINVQATPSGGFSPGNINHGAETGARIGSGFSTTGPTVIVGEGRQGFPEYVIPTDPAHSDNAHKLYDDLGAKLGIGCGGSCGMAAGGFLSPTDVPKPNDAALAAFGSIPASLGSASDQAANFEYQKVLGWVSSMAATASGSGIGGSGPPVAPGACLDLIHQAKALPGYNQSFGDACMAARLNNESGCSTAFPHANMTDSNAAAGTPSVGIAQFLPSTFASQSCPGCTDISNPLCQICASSHCSPGNCGNGGYGCAGGCSLGAMPLATGGIMDAKPWVEWLKKTVPGYPRTTGETMLARQVGFDSGGILPPIRSYDSGGILPPGLSLSYNGTGSAEVVNPRGGQGVVLTDNRQIHLYGDATSPASRAVIREELDHDRAETLRHLRALRGAA